MGHPNARCYIEKTAVEVEKESQHIEVCNYPNKEFQQPLLPYKKICLWSKIYTKGESIRYLTYVCH